MKPPAIALRVWIPLAVAITLGCFGLYASVQQTYRTGADDPQVQLAHDAAAAVNGGASPSSVVPSGAVDPSVSLAPFVIVYDAENRPLAGNGRLSGKTPTPPPGVLDAARASGESRVTWQPRPDARIAAVVVPLEGGGAVLAGRALRVVEERENAALRVAALGWVFTLGATFVAAWAAASLVKDRR